jgi:hypothetical protein
MLVTHKLGNVIGVNPISRHNLLHPNKPLSTLVPRITSITGQIYIGNPCTISLLGVERWGTELATLEEVVAVLSTWLDLHPAKVDDCV